MSRLVLALAGAVAASALSASSASAFDNSQGYYYRYQQAPSAYGANPYFGSGGYSYQQQPFADPLSNSSEASSYGDGAYRPQASAIPRQVVSYSGRHAPGTIVVATRERRLYYVLGNGQAIQYGVGVGRPGFTWSGTKTVTMKREWPDWRPPAQMLRRRPDLPRHMAGGPDNPLGARAMYLGGSLYRIHGSNEPETIGQAVSSGCIRMTNEDVVDLYSRVKVGTRVVVL
jgi:lipoprotein-anchoring transpeptidase ErfK/SrfK